MSDRPITEFLVASCTPDGGVYRCRLYPDGRVDLLDMIPMPSPMYLCLDGDRLWAVLLAPFEGSDSSAVAAFDAKSGEVLTDFIPTEGAEGCHIAVSGDDVYCANYYGHGVFSLKSGLRVHEGHGTDPRRQESAHPHSVELTPDGRYLLCCDLGLDTVFVYNRRLELVSSARVPDGAGARHTVFSSDGRFVYCANEMGCSVSVFSYGDGSLTYIDTASLMPEDYSGGAASAAIRLSHGGRRLYVTERVTKAIVTLDVNGPELSVIARTDCGGREPRDFALLANGKYAVCTNRFDGVVTVFRIDGDGVPARIGNFEVPSPLSAVELLSDEKYM